MLQKLDYLKKSLDKVITLGDFNLIIFLNDIQIVFEI